jgi:hypothetical protein
MDFSNIIITEKAHHINNLNTENLNKQINITVWKSLTKNDNKVVVCISLTFIMGTVSINNLNCVIGIAQGLSEGIK